MFKAKISTAILAIAGATMLAGAGPLSAQSASQPHTISVTGEGQSKAAPDEAQLSAGVVTQAATANAALSANRQAMNAVFATLKKQGIPDREIQTSDFSVLPQYDTGKDGNGPQRLIGYQVSNNVSVTVDDLSKLGPDIDALVSSGANSLGGVSFMIKDQTALLARAREAAVHDAIARAETYAKAAGVTLGPILSISEGGYATPQPMFRMMAEAAPASTPIAVGEQTVPASVSVVFAIK